MSKHEFALYSNEINTIKKVSGVYELQDDTIVHRIYHILRCAVGDTVVLFDAESNIRCSVVECKKKRVTVKVLDYFENKVLTPKINWLLPVLEREAFEQAIYGLAAMGVTSIQPVVTQKSRKKWGTEKDKARIKRIIISAAEQSKYFMLPEIYDPITLSDALHKCESVGVYFDVFGEPAFDVVSTLRTKKVEQFTCLVGPEGDLTAEEKEMVRSHDFLVCQLTPTVLRAWHAVTVGIGILRSLL